MSKNFYRPKGFEDKLYMLAPMVDNSGPAYRKLAKKYGANLCFTEMIHCQSFLRRQQKIYLDYEDKLRIQICGNDPDIMLNVSQKIEHFGEGIDVNFGCPQKVAKRGNYGAFLQDDWENTREIVRNLSENLKKDVSCKIRVFKDPETSIKYARMIEEAGCKMLIVHGRNRDQKGENTGFACWEQIRNIKESLNIPVIANGNIAYQTDIEKCLEKTKADGIMVAETHLYNPLIFSTEKKSPIEVLEEYLSICTENDDWGEIKSHAFKILHNFLNDNREYQEIINKAKNSATLLEIIKNIKENISKTYFLGPKLRFGYKDIV